MPDMNKERVCPYCSNEFDSPPQRKKKCPKCGNFVYVKRSPEEEVSHLVTESEMIRIESLWTEKYFIDNLYLIGLNKEQYAEVKSELLRKDDRADNYQIQWATFDFACKKAKSKNDFGRLSIIFREMAILLYREHRPFIEALLTSNKMQLLEFKQRGVKKVQIVATKYCRNQHCQDLENKILTVDEAIENKLIPCEGAEICSARYYEYYQDSYQQYKESIRPATKATQDVKLSNNIGCWTIVSLLVAIILIPAAPIVAAILAVPAIWLGYKKWKKKS